jgi:hypothetical protein
VNAVTEVEWLNCTDPHPMLEFVRGKVSNRKLRLFACACCRSIWRFMTDDRSRNAVEVAERMADGLATNAERRAAALAAGAVELGKGGAAACAVAVSAYHAAERSSLNAASIFGAAVSAKLHRPRRTDNSAYRSAESTASEKERARQIPLVREIFGNPFHLVSIDTSWLTPDVVRLAQDIYDERASSHLPKLADALEGAGCKNKDILQHCRQPGEHVRGCWVLDLILGKE